MDEKQHPKSSNGFILGMMVGGAIVFLLGTKTGRRILKQFSEKGLDVLDEISNTENFELVPEEEDEIDGFTEEKIEKESGNGVSKNGQSFKKRFFKGIKRK